MSSLMAVVIVTVASTQEGAASPSGAAEAVGATRLELVLNIPAGRIDVFEDGARTASYAVSPGRFEFPTPLGRYSIDRVEWNPWWYPPASEWAKDNTITPPGPANPMGRAKLMFDAPFLYLHGTTASNERWLGKPASHGCVRLANRDVLILARLVGRSASRRVTDGFVDSVEANPARTRTILLDSPVPLRVVYELVEVIGDRIVVHRDVYRRLEGRADLEPMITVALEQAYPDLEVDRKKVAAFAAQSGARPRTAAAGTLLKPAPPVMFAFAADGTNQ